MQQKNITITTLISYEKKSYTTFIQLLRIEKFKNKKNIMKKTQKKKKKEKYYLNVVASEVEKRKKINS